MQELILEEKTTLSPVMKEIYRRLRTNLEFTGIENKVICLTSCMENDGKSSVSFNLAKILAENDKRVLFIDADMRNSVLTKRTGIPDDLKGLSHYLAGKNAASEVIYATNHKNFYVIPTGRFPKNPTELLNKPAYEVLIEGMKQTFDYVIIDTPPLGSVVDAALIAKSADASVLVISANAVSRRMANSVKEQLINANPNFLGVILNKADEGTKHYGYGKRYGSKYGYGYGYGRYGQNPVSLYAATKKSNELMAHAYSKLYNIPSTGLRFFTVYGPAGRPDMAYFGFTNKLLAGDTIQIFNYGNCKRDFTYVDDIVEGVKRVMQCAPEKVKGEDGLPIPPYRVYNIGNNSPENLLDFVDILQQELIRAGVLPEDYDFEAHKKLVPMQPGDVPVTYADTSALERDFGFKPSTSLREGLRRFAEWYKEFYL